MARGKTIDPAGNEVEPATGALAPADRGAMLAAISQLMELVPDAPDDDGSAILARLMAAESWEDLNSQSKLPNGKDMVRRQQKVTGIVKRPSEIEGDDDGTGFRLDYYLVVDGVDINNGEQLRWQTSAPALVLPLAKLHVWGKLPAIVCVNAAEKKTRRGFTPLNLDVQAAG